MHTQRLQFLIEILLLFTNCSNFSILIETVFLFYFVSIFQYLTKQNNALREVNDTRLKIYENIEISIQDLEKQNHRLNVDNSNFKKINKK